MKNNVTRLMLLMFFACVFLISTQSTFASGPDPKTQHAAKDVKVMIEADFMKYQKSLDITKDKFGISGNESFSNAPLGDGTPYYMVSNNSEAGDNGFKFAGYIFPIQVNGKPAGIVFAREINGKWRIFNIKNSLTFEQDVQGAKKLLKNTDQTKLVYDTLYGLNVLVVQHETGESSILSMKDNEALNLKKNSFVPMTDFQVKLHALKNSKVSTSQDQALQLGGIGSVHTGSPNQGNAYSLLMSGAVVVALGTIAFFMVRKRKKVA